MDVTGCCPLFLASLTGNTHDLKLLIEAGANTEMKNTQGQNAVHMAVLSGSTEAVELLIDSGVEVDAQDNNGRSPLHYSVVMDNLTITEILANSCIDFDAIDNEGLSALALAAQSGRPNQLKILLKFGSDVHRLDHQSESVLVKALKQNPFDYVQFFSSGQPEQTQIQKMSGNGSDQSFMNEAITVRVSTLEKSQQQNIMVKGSGLPDETGKFLTVTSDTFFDDQYAEVASLLLNAGCKMEFENEIKSNPVLFSRVNQNKILLKTLMNPDRNNSKNLESNSKEFSGVNEIVRKPKTEEVYKSDEVVLNTSGPSAVKSIPLEAKDSKGTPYLYPTQFIFPVWKNEIYQ